MPFVARFLSPQSEWWENSAFLWLFLNHHVDPFKLLDYSWQAWREEHRLITYRASPDKAICSFPLFIKCKILKCWWLNAAFQSLVDIRYCSIMILNIVRINQRLLSSIHALLKSWPLILLYHSNSIAMSWNVRANGHSYWLLLFASFSQMIHSHKNSMAENWNMQCDRCHLSWLMAKRKKKNLIALSQSTDKN